MKHFIIYENMWDHWGIQIYADDFIEDVHLDEVRFYKNNEVIVSIPRDRVDAIEQEDK